MNRHKKTRQNGQARKQTLQNGGNQMCEKNTFTLGQILSVTHDKLVCEIGQVYVILNHMTRDNLFTHQLPRACRECAPWLRRQFPWLNDIDLDDVTTENWLERLVELQQQYGSQFQVDPIPQDDHDHLDPVEELKSMVGSDKVVVIEIPKSA